ncbi:MAG: replication initiation protein [Betaproteobacteria bacterium]|nr:replication initiation protein [Betaproteobacteria bacterium]
MTQDAGPTKRAKKPARKPASTKKPRTRHVRKCVETVHITNTISLVQRKLLNALLLNAYYQIPDLDIPIHRITVSHLVDLIGYDSHDIGRIKDLLKALTTTAIEWDILNDEGKREWGVSTLLASADIMDGVCTYAYSPHLRMKLFNPKIFVVLDIDIVRRFHSGYSLALYENCARFRGIGMTPYFPMDVVKALLGAREPIYAEFKYLNQRVLQPAIKEINSVTDLALDIEVKREARRVTEVRFLIGSNPQQSMQIEPPREMAVRSESVLPSVASGSDAIAEANTMPTIASSVGVGSRPDIPEPEKPTQEGDEALVEPNSITVRLQKEFCLSVRVAARVCSENSEAAILGSMEYVLSRYNAGKVKDIGPYFLKALKEGAAIRRSEHDLKRENEANTKQTARERLEAQRREKAQAEMTRNQSLWAYFDSLPEDSRHDVLEKFLAWLSASKHKQNIVDIFKRGGLAHPWAKAEFLVFLETFAPPGHY